MQKKVIESMSQKVNQGIGDLRKALKPLGIDIQDGVERRIGESREKAPDWVKNKSRKL